jgi:hypothetical protein
MTPEEALAKAKQIVGPTREYGGRLSIDGDTEAVHGNLDDLLCEILKEHGYTELVEFFQKLDLWYS